MKDLVLYAAFLGSILFVVLQLPTAIDKEIQFTDERVAQHIADN